MTFGTRAASSTKSPLSRAVTATAAACLAAALAACGGGGGTANSPDARPSAAATLGEKIFSDPTLSASGKLSCATCHDPATGHATNRPDIVVPDGGAILATPGFRNAPSLRYLDLNTSFFFDKEGTPTGGFNRDGRAASLIVAVTAPYFHNGRFKSLKELVAFYVRRDTNPEEWYPLNPDGSVNKFDDLPAQYVGNVNRSEAPYNRRAGDAPALSLDEIDLVVDFLNTLTDGYTP